MESLKEKPGFSRSKQAVDKANEHFLELRGEEWKFQTYAMEVNAFAGCYVKHVIPLQKELTLAKEEIGELKKTNVYLANCNAERGNEVMRLEEEIERLKQELENK